MTMEFQSFSAFAAHLQFVAEGEERAVEEGLKKAIRIPLEEARNEIGHYQSAAGPLGAWPSLAQSTKDDRARHGYPEDEPLLRDGTLRDAVESNVADGEAAIGVASRMVGDGKRSVDIGIVAEVQEMGDRHVPARSFLGGAMVRTADEAVHEAVAPFLKLLGGEAAG